MRVAAGPGSIALGGRNRIDRTTSQTPLYRVALDLATRAGIRQGLVLAPEHEQLRAGAPVDASMISVAQAADVIGISRAAVYKAIEKGTLRARRIGNVTIVERGSAAAYKAGRTTADVGARAPRRRRRGATGSRASASSPHA